MCLLFSVRVIRAPISEQKFLLFQISFLIQKPRIKAYSVSVLLVDFAILCKELISETWKMFATQL